ncbi:hypothetical protein BP6252_11697 [Coleophoma cylindrospora]|uniref:Chromosome segregation in meiosis protein n=1 Tax=Coleophoma cylindrospora TaxID=1849047 RepID=A0A3D8QLC8_9HELO|nr:hypothetical protein BP6252_11697 [Coleophoma cylindrospora]
MSSVAPELPTGGPTAGGDEFDDLFDYDVDGEDDPFSNNYNSSTGPLPKPADAENARKGGDDLGLDEEIEVTKKPRVPRVKLDEHRLLSDAGIPKLRKKAKAHLKFKGKGHEYSDAANLLAFYQLWLDDLFPKAKFLDALSMVEKLGHKKQIQIMRMEWINEGRPRSSVHEDAIFDEPALPPSEIEERIATASTRIAPIFEKAATQRPSTPPNADTEMDDIYNATPKPTRNTQTNAPGAQASIFGGGNTSIFGPAIPVDDGPPEDDLDALLAEEEEMLQNAPKSAPATSRAAQAPAADDFEDEMDAMAGMDDPW